MDENIQGLFYQVIDKTISQEDFERLQEALESDEEVCRAYLEVVGLCESLGEIAVVTSLREAYTETPISPLMAETPLQPDRRRFTRVQLAVATALLMIVGIGAFWLGRWNQPVRSEIAIENDDGIEARIAGHATLRRAVGLKWPHDAERHLEGDVLPNGPLVFESGLAEIDFFCGATLIVEGPARLDIESDWSVHVSQGRLRANVPPAARGFVVKAADSEIIDLGTEFALEVRAGNARVEVVDGEVELRGGEHDGKHLLTGEGASLKGTLSDASVVEGLSTILDLDQQRQKAEANGYQAWKVHSHKLRNDDRLIAYFPIAEGLNGRVVPNVAITGTEANGLMVGPVEGVAGRFGSDSTGLEFDRTGARVRTRIDGEFQAFTFTCWTRIDSLEHRYNALFMGDGYEDGEPHWQIRDDGSLMFSVMVDDSQVIEHFSEDEQRMVQHAGLHRVYYTKPFWDISQSGQWFHLAAVYDPASRRVCQYVNGRRVSDEKIIDKFHITQLRIGPAEIGNWGQPFRKTPWFAVRNLNGTIDELSIFNAALSADEIHEIYEQGKPLGY